MNVIRQAAVRACARQSAPWTALRVLFVTALCLGLLTPFIGAAMDHHFAERYSGHVHIYFGANPPKHMHLYERPHSHTHIDESLHGDEGRAVAVISEDSDSPIVTIALGLSGTEGNESGPAREATTLWRVHFEDVLVLSGRDVPPLDQPPRA